MGFLIIGINLAIKKRKHYSRPLRLSDTRYPAKESARVFEICMQQIGCFKHIKTTPSVHSILLYLLITLARRSDLNHCRHSMWVLIIKAKC